MKQKTAIKSTEDFPINWQDCTRAQLEYLAEHGSYGQRLIAKRYLGK